MKCEELLPLIRNYADRELDPPDVERIDTHLGGCAACSKRVEAERELKLAIRAKVRSGPAPAGLAAAVKRSVRAEAGLPAKPIHRQWRLLRERRFLAAGLVACVLVASVTAIWIALSSPGQQGDLPRATSRLTVELVDDHIRYLGVEAPTQVVTADPAEAQRWFASRLDVAVELPRFEKGTVTLRGGRLCYVLDRRVALLFYSRGAQRLSLFVMNASGLDFSGMALVDLTHAECASGSYKGYKVVGWKREGLLFALVADDGRDGLEALVAGAYRE